MSIEWKDDNTAVLNDGKRYMFRGIIRGQGYKVITYFADTVEEITEGLALDQWIYYIKEVC